MPMSIPNYHKKMLSSSMVQYLNSTKIITSRTICHNTVTLLLLYHLIFANKSTTRYIFIVS